MTTGRIKFFNADRGFGFVTPDRGGDDVFVHVKNCNGYEPRDGQSVQYEVRESKKHPGRAEAFNVTPTDRPVQYGNSL